MIYLGITEFEKMERLLAELLSHCDEQEEVMLLQLHTRLTQIHEEQSGLSTSKARLTLLQSQTAQ